MPKMALCRIDDQDLEFCPSGRLLCRQATSETDKLKPSLFLLPILWVRNSERAQSGGQFLIHLTSAGASRAGGSPSLVAPSEWWLRGSWPPSLVFPLAPHPPGLLKAGLCQGDRHGQAAIREFRERCQHSLQPQARIFISSLVL